MGQATVDLPDPLETPTPAGGVGADDLLAQMAGDEIDRLLAEAEAEVPPGLVPAAANKPVEDDLELAARDARVEEEAEARAALSERKVAYEPSTADSSLKGELDTLLDSLTTATPHSPGPAPAAELAPAQPVDPGRTRNEPGESIAISAAETAALLADAEETTAPVAQASAPPSEETSAAERIALGSVTAVPDASVAETAAAAPVDAISTDADANAPLPFFLRPLEWINAPLDACPDFLREFVGKAAILTFVNAGAVIFYVRFIRRH